MLIQKLLISKKMVLISAIGVSESKSECYRINGACSCRTREITIAYVHFDPPDSSKKGV